MRITVSMKHESDDAYRDIDHKAVRLCTRLRERKVKPHFLVRFDASGRSMRWLNEMGDATCNDERTW
jgi:hypothetical protein